MFKLLDYNEEERIAYEHLVLVENACGRSSENYKIAFDFWKKQLENLLKWEKGKI